MDDDPYSMNGVVVLLQNPKGQGDDIFFYLTFSEVSILFCWILARITTLHNTNVIFYNIQDLLCDILRYHMIIYITSHYENMAIFPV